MGIVAEMSNGDTPSDSESEEGYKTPPEGSTDDTHNDSGNGAGETSERTASPINTGLSQESVTDDSNQKLQKVESTSGASNVSNESTEDEVKQKPNEDKGVTLLYTGMMYHEKKEVNQWMTTFSVVRDLEVLQQYLEDKHPEAEKDGPIVPEFKYNQPDGILELHLQDTKSLESGWTVHPDQSPMQIRQNVVDKFINDPMRSSIHISVYAEIGVAKKPLHCPIELTGIDPSIIIYINRSPPPLSMIDSTSSSSSTASISQTRRKTEEGTFRSDIAHRVMTECTGMIKNCGIDIHFLVDKLLECNIINAREKREITDGYTKQTAGERMDELLHIISSSINMEGEVFGIFLDILREEGTRRTIKLADKLLEKYNNNN
ncbi:PREDICTED: uncharacterized protein LOC109583197 [Amphimedon queenslandica]|uniref:CARD domain-containing protein n=2 Tax=Amphimedon queenslandica TaxID=400682 RepID=A0AAN0JAB9_AMPQE|nr:PREDICTED: uncharacterized protein LOC109583197 [Amphimedon queenslandica]|eukprot:XP_019854000.1 PREDICTED: uncharacterized protein LOC109583197 [Amphimedon queenslandica]